MSIKKRSPIDKKFLEQIQSNLQHDFFAKNLTQCLCHKNDNDDMIYEFEESEGLIYCKGIFLCSNKANTTTCPLNTS